MKHLQIFILSLVLMILSASCNKKNEDTSLGKQMEGIWRVYSFLYNDNELLDPEDDFTITFSDYNQGKGKTYWAWLTFIVNAKDRSDGTYSVDDENKTVYIEWDNPLFWGTYETATFNMLQFSNDTMILEEVKLGTTQRITAVRN